MSRKRLPSPQIDECLIHSRKSRYKGGTVIAEDVWSLEEHVKRLSKPDGYRPQSCGCCGRKVLHIHDYRERKPLGLALRVAVRVVRFICANLACRATWLVLPAWLARHLWWPWRAVEQATEKSDTPQASAGASHAASPPPQTVRRWVGRLASSAQQAVVLMASRGTETLKAVAAAVGLNATRQVLVEVYRDIVAVPPGQTLGAVAAVLDRLERGSRLM